MSLQQAKARIRGGKQKNGEKVAKAKSKMIIGKRKRGRKKKMKEIKEEEENKARKARK